MMKNNKQESGLKEIPVAYDSASIVAEVKNGVGFYEACKREQDKRMAPERKSFAVLIEGLKLLTSPDDSFFSADDSVSEPLRRLYRITKKYCIDVYGGKDNIGISFMKKRLDGVLESIYEEKEKREKAKRTNKEHNSDMKPDSFSKAGGMLPDMQSPQSPEEELYAAMSNGRNQPPLQYNNAEQSPVSYQSQPVMPELPPIEVDGRLSDDQKKLLYDMLVANGCTPQEAQSEIMNLRM